jgi:hypothetical protein
MVVLNFYCGISTSPYIVSLKRKSYKSFAARKKNKMPLYILALQLIMKAAPLVNVMFSPD